MSFAMLFRLAIKLCVACVGSLAFTAIFIAARNTRLQLLSNASSFDKNHKNRVQDSAFAEERGSVLSPGDSHGRDSSSQPDLSRSLSPESVVPQADDTLEIPAPPLISAPSSKGLFPQVGDLLHSTHNEILSVSTADRKYFLIEFGVQGEALNPSIIPHPLSNDKWMIVAQKSNNRLAYQVSHTGLVCNATFRPDGALECDTDPVILPLVAATSPGEPCTTSLAFNIGPVFYGPLSPYLLYGRNSQSTCVGQWIVDFRTLVDWWDTASLAENEIFLAPTELQRQPSSYGNTQTERKNWFLFWDANGEPYVHYGFFPRRSFAKINVVGDAGTTDDVDLTSISGSELADDSKCLLKPDRESEFMIHQATNSLSITLCQRSEPSCEPDDSNTFILVIFNKELVHTTGSYSTYEPYTMLFRRVSPFQIHGVSRKPLWIHGRDIADDGRREMMYATALSWKNHSLKYHGYYDDVIFLAFEIDGARMGGIDVLASDLLRDMDLCADA